MKAQVFFAVMTILSSMLYIGSRNAKVDALVNIDGILASIIIFSTGFIITLIIDK